MTTTPILPPALAGQTLLIEPQAGAAFLSSLAQQQQPTAAEPERWRKVRRVFSPRPEITDGVAVLEVSGVLAYRPDIGAMAFDGVEDSAEVLRAFRDLEDNPKVLSIVLNINSPGGFIVGGAEIADAIHGASKPVVAWTGGMMCSLAYWIGSQADSVIASRSAMVGSIGAYIAVADYSRMLENAGITVHVFRNAEGTFKGAGIPGAPIADDHAAEFQRSAQRAFDMFARDVRRQRGAVADSAMRGQVFDGERALDSALVDGLGSLDEAIQKARELASRGHNARMGKSATARGTNMNADTAPQATADEQAATIANLTAERDQLRADLETVRASLATITAERDAVLESSKALQAHNSTIEAARDAAIAERAAAIKSAAEATAKLGEFNAAVAAEVKRLGLGKSPAAASVAPPSGRFLDQNLTDLCRAARGA